MQGYGDDAEYGDPLEGSSDEEQNDQMDDIDEADGDGDADMEKEDDEESENSNDDEEDMDDAFKEDDGQSQNHEIHNPFETQISLDTQDQRDVGEASVLLNGPQLPVPEGGIPIPIYLNPLSPRRSATLLDGSTVWRPTVRPEALAASVYDIVPTIAAPHSTSINAITATPDLRWVFTGGSDGYIRKFNWIDTANGKVMLTVAQRHPFVDSVTKAGVLTSYWENEEPHAKSTDDGTALSPVYSLAVHNQGLWLLSGLDSGNINLQSVRHEEGKRIVPLKGHTSAVSVLNLAQDEKSVLSGSWDKLVLDWDLDTGKIKRSFVGSSGQISAIEMRPLSSLAIPATTEEKPLTNGTFFSNSGDKTRVNGNAGDESISDMHLPEENGFADAHGSPADSLFNGNDHDSLFGDNDDENAGASARRNYGDDEDDDFSRAIVNGMQQQENEEADGNVDMINADGLGAAPHVNGNEPGIALAAATSGSPSTTLNGNPSGLPNGLPHAEDLEHSSTSRNGAAESAPVADSIFLAASIDGTIRVWDRRQNAPVAKISTSSGVPPWCMAACWSPDGNAIYAGRRNGTVEEFNLHKGLRTAERTFKFPSGSGPVTAVRAMPNGRHLICASYDILRLYDLQQQQTFKHSSVPFLIVPGHRTGVISQLYIDPTCTYMISTAGNRGWEGATTEVLLGYEVNI